MVTLNVKFKGIVPLLSRLLMSFLARAWHADKKINHQKLMLSVAYYHTRW